MKRIVACGFATLALLVIGAGTASADPPPMTYDMTYNVAPVSSDMTYN